MKKIVILNELQVKKKLMKFEHIQVYYLKTFSIIKYSYNSFSIYFTNIFTFCLCCYNL